MDMLELYNQRNNFVIFFHHEMAFLDKVSKTASFATGLHVACLASVSFLQQLQPCAGPSLSSLCALEPGFGSGIYSNLI